MNPTSPTKTTNLLQGPILPALSQLAMPIMATALVQMAYNLTDMAWIGRLGPNAVAAVGAAGMFTWFAQGVMNISRMGGQVMVAQNVGAGNEKEARFFLRASLQLTILLALAYGLVCLVFAKPLLGFFRLSNPDTIRQSHEYFRIVCGLIIFAFLNQTLTGLYTSIGDSRTPFLANCIGLGGNMILDPVLIFGLGPVPKLGAAGAAIATVSAQAVVTLTLLLLRRRSGSAVFQGIHLLTPAPFRCFKSVTRVGLPASLQTMTYCFISMVLTRMVSAWGDSAIAVQRVGSQVESLAWMTCDGFGSAVNTFMAQNYGAGQFKRIKKSYGASLLLMFLWGSFASFLLYFGARPLFSLFITDPDIIPEGIRYLQVISYGEMFMCLELMTVGALSGLGKTGICSIISMTLTGARIPLALALSSTALALGGIWWAFTVSSILKGITFTIVFLLILKKLEPKA